MTDSLILMAFLIAIVFLSGALLAATPWFMKKNECFAVTIPESAQADVRFLAFRKRYAVAVLAVTLICAVALGDKQGHHHLCKRRQMRERGLVDHRVRHLDALARKRLERGVAPRHIVHDAAPPADLDVVTRLHEPGDAHLHAADQVRERVLEAERDGDAADTERGDRR